MKTFYECSICGEIYDDYDACYEHEKTCPSYYLGHYFEDSVFDGQIIYVAELIDDTFKCVLYPSKDTPDKYTPQTFSIKHLCHRAKRRLTKEDVKELIDRTPAPI